jgi:hypothetical protein
VPTHRLYAGLALYTSANQSILGLYEGQRLNLPVQATLGYQLRPRLALQLSLAYSGQKSTYANTSSFIDSNALPVTHDFTYTFSRRTTSALLLARYTLTRRASHRFQVDALGGLSLDHIAYRSTGTDTYIRQGIIEVVPYDHADAYNSLRINLGPSFRYRCTERLEVVYDVLFNALLTSSTRSYNTAMALGLRYRFGQPG